MRTGVQVQVAVMLLGVGLAAAQEQRAGFASTNSGALPTKEELTLSLPRIGVELDSLQTQVVEPEAGVDEGPAVVLFQKPTVVAAGSSSVETDKQVITVPLDSLEFRRETEVARAGGLAINGPLVDLFHGAKPMEVPRRLLHLINPFAAVEATPIAPEVSNEHPRAWTTLVGWNPGGSAFPDPRTHVPALDLLSMFTSP